jgi:3' terminal RNA ribose 2'-O-methyltransferase Hen1
LITGRYLSKSRDLRALANVLLAAGTVAEDAAPEEIEAQIDDARRSPHDLRHMRIVEDIRAFSARTVVDLGCGEGRLLQRLSKVPGLHRIVGLEPSIDDLESAKKLLSRNAVRAMDPRIELMHGSILYKDKRLAGFDVAVLSEVVEHVDEPRLPQLSRCVFGQMRPRKVIVTTPNRDFNRAFFMGDPGAFRHADHRFEWSVEECRAWATSVCTNYDYTVDISGEGGHDPEFGHLSHYLVFTSTEA